MALVPPGEYIAKLVEHGIQEPKEAGKAPQAVLTFEIEVGGTRRRITAYKSFSPAAAKWTLKALIACGMRSDDPSSINQHNAFDGREVSITVKHETGNDGKTRAVVEWINSLSKFKRMNPIAAKATLSSFSTYVKGMRAEMGDPQPSSDFAPADDINIED